MNASSVKPHASISKMIRADHTHVLAVFHKYTIDAAPRTKQALVDTVCLALEIHAQLEEEILYPAVAEVNSALVSKNVPEHEEMHRLMSELRGLEPTSAGFDDIFLELMRTVIHHVADEETVLLPEAERLLADRLGELGTQMAKRRRQLMLPRAAEMTRNAVRAMPTKTMLVGAGALIAGTYVLRYALKKSP
ncbi:MAG: hemerythrin domain-containing protein [Burkholderiales bacterium]